MAIEYTVIGRLKEILEFSPVERGSIWYVTEPVWETIHPEYGNVRNRKRRGHFALAAATLTPGTAGAPPESVPLCHGHRDALWREDWFHLAVKGVTKAKPGITTRFDVWHRYPMPWGEFISKRKVYPNGDKEQLTPNEATRLRNIEARIAAQTRADYAQAVDAYQANPAWRKYFPPRPPGSGGTTAGSAVPA